MKVAFETSGPVDFVKDGLIKSMDLKGEKAGSSSGPSAAFAKH